MFDPVYLCAVCALSVFIEPRKCAIPDTSARGTGPDFRECFAALKTTWELCNMAFSAFRGTTSPRDEPSYPVHATNPLSPPRNSNRLSGGVMSSAAESRAGLQRRFTTNALPTLSPIGQQRLQAVGEIKQSEQKSRFYESLLAEQRRIQAYIEQIDPETRREVDENLRHEHAVSQMIAQSEPTTPPDYSDAFPSAFSKPNRYSMTSLTSAPSMFTRPNRASTQFTSPPMGLSRLYNGSNNLPSQSVPGSRRHSDDEEDIDDLMPSYDAQRTVTNPNRNSLPVTRHDRQQASVPDLSSVLGPVNTTGFLFGENKRTSITSKSIHTSPQDGKTYLQVQHTADGFPKLIRREENGTDAATIELASPKQETQSIAARNRISLPPTALRNNDANIAGISGVLNSNEKTYPNNRRSIEARPSLKTTPPRSLANGNLQAPYSTNDVPTLKSINASVTSPSTRALDAHSGHNKNSSIHSAGYHASHKSQDFGSEADINMSSPKSGLHASAMPFGPTGSVTSADMTNDTTAMQYGQPAFYGGYGVNMLSNGFAAMNFNGQTNQWQQPSFQPNTYNGYAVYQNQSQAVTGAPRAAAAAESHRPYTRARNTDDSTVVSNLQIHDVRGKVFELCTDQHGCRFLQRKLDDRDPATLNIIFEEVRPKIYQLMIDPFGNYLCQKLLEYCSDQQRTELIDGTTNRMAEIALNQHGTRALQKMIEFIVTEEQTELIIEALRFKVVMLIQDLNGNHVIQKCLNHLKSADAQFIFDAVGANCVTVGTHRHGCCVLQRCIDHATGTQKGTLVAQITSNAMTLIQDPFGNYVIQYILDIAEPAFTEPLCKAFLGSICLLSTQKFSSNVIEKCIRCASKDTKDLIINEISIPGNLETMLRDSYANYVVQTAIDYASDDIKPKFVANIRPLLNAVRHTPYGRRIQSKINDYDGQIPGAASPAERLNAGMNNTTPNGILASYGAYGPPNSARNNRMGFIGAPPAWNLNGNNTIPVSGVGSGLSVNGYSNHMMDPSAANYNAQTFNARPSQANYRFF
ncbi:hypothetical protein AMS68_007807 [Peltaster fructicola]|uniref:PUM-HD domain-containing protein n=1 Tax=Peltaster fructicola TaxID=286661 RepID=A0A6H0Y6R1_9PEZI|nr:hypothetical protein AMS68_007807 [Peltaster fructicola]